MDYRLLLFVASIQTWYYAICTELMDFKLHLFEDESKLIFNFFGYCKLLRMFNHVGSLFLISTGPYLHSMEEAKKNMYAFSTTTYTGFQCTVSEETSEKFKGKLI